MSVNVSRTRVAALCVVALLAGCTSRTTPEARIAHADQLLAQGDYGAALVEVKNALQDKPDSAAALLALARISIAFGNFDSAEHALNDALAHGADRATASTLRVELLRLKGAHQELLKQLDAKALDIDAPHATLARAQALAGLQRCAEAIDGARR